MCVDSDREDNSVEPFPLCPLQPWLNLFPLIWFQGSEWNAANFEELQKNKLVFSTTHLFIIVSYCGRHSILFLCFTDSTIRFFQCGLHSEYDKGDWQLFPRLFHLHEYQSAGRGNHRPALALDRHIQLHQHCKVHTLKDQGFVDPKMKTQTLSSFSGAPYLL